MRSARFRWWLLGSFCAILLTSSAPRIHAQTQVASAGLSARRTAHKVTTDFDQQLAEQHPLWPALEIAAQSYKHIRLHVRDYSCNLVRQERVNGRLRSTEYMAAKVRHRRTKDGEVVVPFGVYLKVLAPSKFKGREILYVEGKNDGDMLVRNGGKRFPFITTRINPNSDTALADNRYPLTEFGIENLVTRLIEVVKEDIRLTDDTDVQFFNNAKIDGRSCTGVVVLHPNYDSRLRFHKASVFVDNELKLPVRYEAYDWPRDQGDDPILLEQYTYRDIKVNVGYTDRDFDADNPNYKVR